MSHYAEFREFPPEDRIDVIGQNGNNGEHYPINDQVDAILSLNADNRQLGHVRARDGKKSGLNYVHAAHLRG